MDKASQYKHETRHNITGENESPPLVYERVPSKDELGKVLRKEFPRGRVAISMSQKDSLMKI